MKKHGYDFVALLQLTEVSEAAERFSEQERLLSDLPSSLPFQSVNDYYDDIARLGRVPTLGERITKWIARRK